MAYPMTIGFFADRRLCSQTHDWRWSVQSDSEVERAATQLCTARSGFNGCFNIGRSTRKQLPFPSSVVTLISAPCAVQIALTIDSPRPVPPEERERALSAQ